MNSKTLIRKALSLCLTTAIIATYSMVALAGREKIAGELLVSGKNSSVIVNGESAQSGRSVFSASTIATPDGTSAIVNLGEAGKIELGPNTVANISFTDKGISGDLLSGKITVLGSSDAVNVKTADGKSLKLNAGESASAARAAQDDDDDDDDAMAWWIWVAIFGGAAAGVVIAATSDNNRVALGGGTTVVSTNR